jgi:SpoIIAA-like
MPEGTLGLLASGRIGRDEYHEQLLAPIREVVERGDTLNLVFATEPDFSGLDMGALWEDTKAVGTIGLRHHGAFGRFAVVSDKDWLRHGVSAFGWLSPGELRMFEPDELDAAKAWVAGTA